MMDRSAWETLGDTCHIGLVPRLTCPYCLSDKSLKLDRDSLTYREVGSALVERKHHPSSKSKKQYSDKNKSSLSALLGLALGLIDIASSTIVKYICFHVCESCSKSVSSSGTGIVERYKDSLGQERHDLRNVKVEFFTPTVPIFAMSQYVPDSVKNELYMAFGHYLIDEPSCGTKLRRAMEMAVRELGYSTGNSKLHNDLKKLERDFPEYDGYFSAVKLLGNEAVHGSDICREDLLDAMEVLSYAFELFEKQQVKKRISELAKNLDSRYQSMRK